MLETILVATDLSERSDRAIRRGFSIARAQNARLIILGVVDDALPLRIVQEITTDATQSLTRFGETLAEGVPFEVRLLAGDPTEVIIAQSKEVNADLLILGTHRDRDFLGLLRETTAQRVTRLVEAPVLIAADREERAYEAVVLGADFSPNATAGAALAALLAPGAEITPVHALHVPYRGMLTHGGGLDDMLETFSKEPRENDAQWRRSTDLPDQLAATQIVEGSAAEALSQVARRKDAHLIVVGAHGRVGQMRAFLGSVAADLMRAPPCDVLIVRQRQA